jgi:hypothetical protein
MDGEGGTPCGGNDNICEDGACGGCDTVIPDGDSGGDQSAFTGD